MAINTSTGAAPPNDKRHLPYGSAFAIQDHDTLAVLREPLDLACLHDVGVVADFLDRYHAWILGSVNNRVIGLDQYPYRCFSLGTSESFDKFYLRNRTRRFRCFRGEYLYHRLAWRDHFDWCYLDDAPLQDNDAVVMSVPFSDTGDVHAQSQQVLAQCDLRGIPVLVDCAFFGICYDVDFDFSAPCITDITFSLSKAFPVAHARIGMRYSRQDHDDTLFVHAKLDYVNRMSASLGLRFLQEFGADFIPDRYRAAQLDLCQELGVVPTRTVLFGLGSDEWKIYNRGLDTNRLSFHRQLPQRVSHSS